MAKKALKKKILAIDKGLTDLALLDTHRIKPKLKGGTYTTESNVKVIDPIAHMKLHGTFRERPEWLDSLKALFDDRSQTMKLKNKINNQLLAFMRRTDVPDESTKSFLEETLVMPNTRLKEKDKEITKALKEIKDPLVKAALGVPGLGPVIIGMFLVYLDVTKAPHASSIWSYVGFHKPSHSRYDKDERQQERREARGEAFYGGGVPTGWGGNKTLRTQLYVTAGSIIRLSGKKTITIPYEEIYRREKDKLSVSEKIVSTRTTAGKLIEAPWKDTKPSHRDGAARRKMLKHILADYWYVARELAGLPVGVPYAIEKLGHTGWIKPQENGWVW